MVKIFDVISSLAENVSAGSVSTNQKRVVIVIDVSGSTGTEFIRGMSVLEKEIQIMEQFILANPDDTYIVIAFDDRVQTHNVIVLKDEQMTNVHNFGLRPGSSTLTGRAFATVNALQNKPDLIILLTDGQTNSTEQEIKNEVKKFIDGGSTLEVIAVSASNIDLTTITHNEEQRIPGMDLLGHIGNAVSKMSIYNRRYIDDPFIGATGTSLNKKQLMFLNVPVKGFVIDFIKSIIEKLKTEQIEWGTNHIDFKNFLAEIGKFLTILFVDFPENNIFVENMVNDIKISCGIDGMTDERIMNIIKYGFSCTRNKKPIMMTNFEQHVKEGQVKKTEFADAISQLKTQGTSLNSNVSISFPTNGVIVISHDNSVELVRNLGQYPNSCDKFGNYYFGCDSNAQAIRIALREYCGVVCGVRNAIGSHSVPFYVANQMSLLTVLGHSSDSQHMKMLRELAIMQTSLETIVAKNKYSGIGCYQQWKQGILPKIHFTDSKTHTSLYSDPFVNPLNLSEPLWWALMMSMLGIFNEQLSTYEEALKSLGIEPTENDFLKWIRYNYASCVEGKVEVVTIKTPPTSVFTLSEFEPTDEVFVLRDHGNCTTKTHYSKHEITDYVMQFGKGCVWCHYMPTMNDFERVSFQAPDTIIQNAMSISRPVHFDVGKVKETNVRLGISSISLSSDKLIRVNLIGITGAGKSTFAQKLSEVIEQKGGKTLVISADKHSKRGKKGREMTNAINTEFHDFEKLKSKLKVVIVDLCNENGPQRDCFGINFSNYDTYDVYPNMDIQKFDEYEAWCLRNVLSRPLHTLDTLYWLNPVSAGVNTCIKVHKAKTQSIRRFKNITIPSLNLSESWTMDQTLEFIKTKADAYAEHLKKSSIEKNVDDFVNQLNI